MKKIEFEQKLSNKDLIEYNYFVAKSNKSTHITTKIMGLIVVGLGVYSLCKDIHSNTIWNIIIVLSGLFCIFGLMPLLKAIVIIKINKRKEEMKPIEVGFDDNGFLYCFVDEKNKNEVIVLWKNITKIVEKEKYLFVYMYGGSKIAIIKKEAVQDISTLYQLINEKITSEKLFIRMKRKETTCK